MLIRTNYSKFVNQLFPQTINCCTYLDSVTVINQLTRLMMGIAGNTYPILRGSFRVTTTELNYPPVGCVVCTQRDGKVDIFCNRSPTSIFA